MDFLPSFSEFSNKLKKNKNQIVYTKFSADLDTPVSLMMKLAKEEKNSFLLESVTGGEIKGRYSVIGMNPDLIWKCNLEKQHTITINTIFGSNNHSYCLLDIFFIKLYVNTHRCQIHSLNNPHIFLHNTFYSVFRHIFTYIYT